MRWKIMNEDLSCDYHDMFIKQVLIDLRDKGKSYVFTDEQLQRVKEIIDIKITYRDDFAIYIECDENANI